jgi:hypothetical protein
LTSESLPATGSRKTRLRTAPDDKSFIPHISSELLQMRDNEDSMGARLPAKPPPAHPFLFHLSKNTFQTRARRLRPRKTREKRKAAAFLAFAGARLIGLALGPVKPIS